MAKRSYGWSPSAPDIRDAQYAFRAAPATLAALPERVDLSDDIGTKPWTPVWNQGPIGSCGPHSAAADIVFAAFRQQQLAEVPMPSRLFVYYTTRMLMGTVESDSGVDNRSLLKALAKYGWCDEELWPYVPSDFRKEPSKAAIEQAKARRIDQYQAVPQQLEQMKACLAGGDPFIFGFSVYSSISHAEGSGNIPFPKLSDSREGGHDVLIVGYDDSRRVFLLRNSWGDWGRDGYGTIPYEYATHPKLASDFWTVKWASLPQPEPAPTPDPVPPSPAPSPDPVPPSPAPSPTGIITINLDTKHAALPAGWTGSINKR